MYKKFAIATILSVYLLIFIGGVVRATGSGMGCPDWPKCFGQWIPPTSVNQLPINYQEIFGAKLKGEVEFNAFKTWTEYVNRLFGVLIGIFIFISFILSYKKYRKSNRKVVYLSLFALLLVIFEGWLGSKVVSSELHPVLITAHMLLSLVIVALLLESLFAAEWQNSNITIINNSGNQFLLLLILILSIGQLLLGTQVRESIDQLYLNGIPRLEWFSKLGGNIYTHISLGLLIVISTLFTYFKLVIQINIKFKPILKIVLLLVITEFCIGAVLGIFRMPAFAQPFHLTIGTLIIGLIYFLLMFSRKSTKFP